MTKIKSKSEAKRIAIQKGYDPVAAVKEFSQPTTCYYHNDTELKKDNLERFWRCPKNGCEYARLVQVRYCSHCQGRCACHKENADFNVLICGCAMPGLLEPALSIQEIKKIAKYYSNLEEIVERVAMEVYRMRHPWKDGSTSHHGGPQASYESFYVENDNIEANLDTGCCGSYDSDCVIFPLSYLHDDDWREKELAKIKHEKEVWDAKQKEYAKQRAIEQTADEKALYQKLKVKFEKKKV